MMKTKFVEGIWYETEGSSPYHVLFEQVSRTKGSLGHWMPLDPANSYARMNANLVHIPTISQVFKTPHNYSQLQEKL